ncbi:hypothetical protein BJ508DRAFT_361594 [Ascobolus immersus RN42]|uniref:Uncharacterized protein n=1 Tax=Ascobolus immersus RN42 TaxID=1160509 RepID=A0A3N4I7C8_ASCIM|nr:hypothetical protein BJ508DRAFT_361594 [Ascobolus immersus RN42]
MGLWIPFVRTAGYGLGNTRIYQLEDYRSGITSFGFECKYARNVSDQFDQECNTPFSVLRRITTSGRFNNAPRLQYPLTRISGEEYAFSGQALYSTDDPQFLDHGRLSSLRLLGSLCYEETSSPLWKVLESYLFCIHQELEPYLCRFEVTDSEDESPHSTVFWYAFHIAQPLRYAADYQLEKNGSSVQGLQEAVYDSLSRMRAMMSAGSRCEEIYQECASLLAIVQETCEAIFSVILQEEGLLTVNQEEMESTQYCEEGGGRSPSSENERESYKTAEFLHLQSHIMALGRYGREEDLKKIQLEAFQKGYGKLEIGTPAVDSSICGIPIFEELTRGCDECSGRRDMAYHWTVD